MADQNGHEYVNETINSFGNVYINANETSVSHKSCGIYTDLEDPDKPEQHCYDKIQKRDISSKLDGGQRPGFNDTTSVPDSTTHLQPRPVNDGYMLMNPVSSAAQPQSVNLIKSKPTNIVKRELKDGYIEFETFGRQTDEESDSSGIQSIAAIQISSDGYLTPAPAPVSRQSEERPRTEEHHYNSIYDTNDIEKRRNENNSACVSKKICRILAGLFTIALNVVFIIIIIYLLSPELKGEQETTVSPNTSMVLSSSNNDSGSGDVKFVFVNESLAWANAVTYCRRIHGGTLADVFINTKTASIEIPQSTSIWVGRYSTHTNWTSIKGCYSYNVTDNIPPITIILNSVAECQEKCRNHQFIALRASHCFCLTREPSDSEGSDECSLTCSGDVTNMCGGTIPVVTVYERVSDYEQINTFPAENQQPCGSIENTKQIFQRNCSNNFQALCKSYIEQQFNLFFIPGQQQNINGYYNWDKSRELCNSYNGNLVDFKAAKTVGFYSGSTWIGLFKSSKNLTVEKSQPSPSSVITCTDYLNEVFNVFNSQDCLGLKKPFICKIGNL